MSGQRFGLRLQMHVNEVDDRGYPVSGSGISIQDNIVLGDLGFLEIAQVLGRFHDLAQVIEREREDVTG